MNQLTIVTNPNCHNCEKLKEFLRFYNIEFIEMPSSLPHVQDLLKKHHLTVVPQIFVGDQLFIHGGYRTIKTMRRDEILDRLK